MSHQSISELADSFSLPGVVSFEEVAPGYSLIAIENAFGTARVALHGAHVLEWTPVGTDPVLYLSPAAVLREGKAIRGGIPVCWPWFNAHPTDPDKPSHGFARNRFWKLIDVEDDPEAGTSLSFELCSSRETRALWPHEFQARVRLLVGRSLSVSITALNRSESAFVVGGALHTYLRVGELEQVRIEGLDGSGYLDTVGEPTERIQSGALVIDREVDRIFRSEQRVTLSDPAHHRVLAIDKSGSKTTVVWNPWVEKSRALGDLPDDGYREFVCVEATNALEDVYALKPGESHTLETRISVAVDR